VNYRVVSSNDIIKVEKIGLASKKCERRITLSETIFLSDREMRKHYIMYKYVKRSSLNFELD